MDYRFYKKNKVQGDALVFFSYPNLFSRFSYRNLLGNLFYTVLNKLYHNKLSSLCIGSADSYFLYLYQ